MLAMFAGGPASSSSAQSHAGYALAHSLASWRQMHSLLTALTAACLNLLEQLGALCAAETRKATILQGKYSRKHARVHMLDLLARARGCHSFEGLHASTDRLTK